MSAVGQRTVLGVFLGVWLQPDRDPAELKPEHAELVMRDLRRFSRAAWVPQAWKDLQGAPKLNAGTDEEFRTEATQLIERDDWWRKLLISTRQPHIVGLDVGSLHVVLDLTPIATGAAGLLVVGRFLNLIERYWHLRLRLQAEAHQLRAQLQEAVTEGDQQARRCMFIADQASDAGDDEREILDFVLPRDGVVVSTVEDLHRELGGQ